jgi:AAA15 family ATPase/GTPase
MIKLISITTHGIKNIASDITLDFIGRNSLDGFNFTGNNVKAIYGSNGSGKTAFITSVLFAKHLLLNRSYLVAKSPEYFDSIINKQGKEFSFKVVFVSANQDNSDERVLEYSLLVKKNSKSPLQNFSIVDEQISEKDKTNLSSTGKNIIHIKNGAIVAVDETDPAVSLLKDKTANLLDGATIVSLFYSMPIFHAESIHKMKSHILFSINRCCYLALNLFVYLDGDDLHENYFPLPNSLLNGFEQMKPEEFASFLKNKFGSVAYHRTRVKISEYSSYEKYIGRLTAFISVFKPKLVKIEIEKKENEGFYFCANTFVYENYRIDEEFESTGIKKLVYLFKFLDYASRGALVFIDEIDSNLAGVFLTKLVEYMLQYANGQLCFTAHNTEPMVPLSKPKKSIYFLGDNNEFFPWIKNGNYKPYNLYPEGMIKGIPFNVDSFDFMKIFSEK